MSDQTNAVRISTKTLFCIYSSLLNYYIIVSIILLLNSLPSKSILFYPNPTSNVSPPLSNLRSVQLGFTFTFIGQFS